MNEFIAKYHQQILGTVSGFDRLVLRGTPRRLSFGKGMEEYLWQNGILFKDYAKRMKGISERVKQASLKPFREQGLTIKYVASPQVDKDALAREFAAKQGIERGLVCALSCLEPSPTYEHYGRHMVARVRPCHVLYHYQIHPVLGWLHSRVQTWFPFHIQVAINGREWLAQQMRREGLHFRQQDNCFVWIEDWERAQTLMNEQLRVDWVALLEEFRRQLNPLHETIFERYPTGYYWTCYQSEWATDVVFQERQQLVELMPKLLRHGLLSFHSPSVLRFLGKAVTKAGEVPKYFNGKLHSDCKTREEGRRVKFFLSGNSLKYYDKAYSPEGSVLRVAETTINRVDQYKVYRPKQGGPEDDLAWRKLRKGTADIHRRAEVSQQANERLMSALAGVDDSRNVAELTTVIQRPVTWQHNRFRALRPWGEDAVLVAALSDGAFLLNGLRNRDLQQRLYGEPANSDTERRRRSAAVSRKLRMLRAHGLIQKVPRTHRYTVTESGRTILVAIQTTARLSLDQLNQIAA